jgi:prepilin-type N-terminal cleavage/methylation domain-containing protein
MWSKAKRQMTKTDSERATHSAFDYRRSTFGPQRGFTLLEMMIASGIFAVMMILIVGAMLGISNAELKAGKTQSIQDNLRFALESMTKEMRTATNIQVFGNDRITFTRSDGAEILYCIRSGAIQKRINGGNGCGVGQTSAVTDSSVTIEILRFEVTGESAGAADGQPRITVAIRARSTDANLATALQLQTTVTVRIRDAG